ncbi:MAG: transporter substrate-binding domain-containing protein [Clostridiales bacterium]|nr:transporter substrate-binding domain-containing protein [Clostridiales bacterium]
MKKDGKLGEIATNWFGSDTTTVADSFTGSDASDDSWNKVKDAGKFVLGLDDSFPPMGFRDDSNNIVGFDIDVAKEVCSRLGVELVLQPISWDAKEQELSTGKVDCLWNGFSYSDERNEQMCLSDSYMDNRQVVVVTEKSPIQKLSDLKDKTLAVQAGSTAVEALDGAADVKASLKGGKGVEVKDNVLAMMDLGTGGSDAVLMDEVVARYYIAKMKK